MINNYVDVRTLNILAKKKANVLTGMGYYEWSFLLK